MTSPLLLFTPERKWEQTKDGDLRALQIFHRHYSYKPYKDGRQSNLFCGPGQKLVLITYTHDAIFVWRKFKSMNNQEGINCAVFRNESSFLSSELILEAEEIAHLKWPNERLYTYVNAGKVKSKNPGYCFKMAGWKECGITKVNKLLIFEKKC